MDKTKKIGIKLFDGTFVPVLEVNKPKNKRLVLTTVQDNQKKAIIELYEGTDNNCMYNDFLGKIIIPINRNTKKGAPAIEANLRLDNNGLLHVKAWDTESNEQSQIIIEHSSAKKIQKDNEKNIDSTITADEKERITDYQKPSKNSFLLPFIIASCILIFIIILLLLFFFFGKPYIAVLKNKITNMTLQNNKKIKDDKKIIKKDDKKIEEKKDDKITEDVNKNKETDKENLGINKPEGKPHFVRWGDNLWNICYKYYDDPWYYPALAKANNIKNPRLIYAGTKIIIPAKSALKRWSLIEK